MDVYTRAGRGARERLNGGDRWAPPARAPRGGAALPRERLAAAPQSAAGAPAQHGIASGRVWDIPSEADPASRLSQDSSLRSKEVLPRVRVKLAVNLWLPLPRVAVVGTVKRSLASLLAAPRGLDASANTQHPHKRTETAINGFIMTKELVFSCLSFLKYFLRDLLVLAGGRKQNCSIPLMEINWKCSLEDTDTRRTLTVLEGWLTTAPEEIQRG
ncbi:uncharacterized protein LOC128815088 [Vidua macroura]|uniref:uncharacterized protein LOC128815088 n=1 Tax=Vidua macroura TaxID=187451 RepID=UPI0023A79493|nr:uncharacterized protein LOC128815088 [Vidua macroura]